MFYSDLRITKTFKNLNIPLGGGFFLFLSKDKEKVSVPINGTIYKVKNNGHKNIIASTISNSFLYDEDSNRFISRANALVQKLLNKAIPDISKELASHSADEMPCPPSEKIQSDEFIYTSVGHFPYFDNDQLRIPLSKTKYLIFSKNLEKTKVKVNITIKKSCFFGDLTECHENHNYDKGDKDNLYDEKIINTFIKSNLS